MQTSSCAIVKPQFTEAILDKARTPPDSGEFGLYGPTREVKETFGVDDDVGILRMIDQLAGIS